MASVDHLADHRVDMIERLRESSQPNTPSCGKQPAKKSRRDDPISVAPDSQDSLIRQNMIITSLDFGPEFHYQVLSFAVLSVFLRQTTIRISSDDNQFILYDAFIRSDPSLESKSPPFYLEVKEFCFVPVRSFIYL